MSEAASIERKALTGPEQARRHREKRAAARTPTDVQFDRELRVVVTENVANASMTLALAVSLVRERLVRRGYAVDGVTSIIAGYRAIEDSQHDCSAL